MRHINLDLSRLTVTVLGVLKTPGFTAKRGTGTRKWVVVTNFLTRIVKAHGTVSWVAASIRITVETTIAATIVRLEKGIAINAA